MMDINEIKKILPHRYPFLLVDRVEEMEPGKSITAIKNVTVNEEFFQGHFPEEPVMPGVLILESLAQAGAIALLSLEEYAGKIVYFGSIDKARFRRKVVPGDTLTLKVEIIRLRGRAGTGTGKAYVGDALAAECQFMFMMGE